MVERIFSKTTPLERRIAGVFITMVFFVFILMPLLRENKALNRQILQTKNRLLRYKQITIREDLIKKEYQRFFPDSGSQTADKSLIYDLKALEVVAAKSAIKIIDMKQAILGSADSLVLIELLLEGKKEDYIRFIYDLACSSLLFNMRKCDFKPKENSYLLEAKFSISYITNR